MQVNTFKAVHDMAVQHATHTIELPEITDFGELFKSATPITNLRNYKSSYIDHWPSYKPGKYCSLLSFCAVDGIGETWDLDVIPHIRIIDHIRNNTLHGENFLLNFVIYERKEPHVMFVQVQYTQMIADHYLAIIDPESVPGRPLQVTKDDKDSG